MFDIYYELWHNFFSKENCFFDEIIGPIKKLSRGISENNF